MTHDTRPQGAAQPGTSVTARIPFEVHREIRIESAHAGLGIGELITAAWEAYKVANPQPWRRGERQTRRAS